MAKQNKSNVVVFFKNLGLLLRCLFSALSYICLWTGIVLFKAELGISMMIIGGLLTVIAILTNIIIPVIRLK